MGLHDYHGNEYISGILHLSDSHAPGLKPEETLDLSLVVVDIETNIF